jgi:Uma2 family endonuclease
MSEGAAIRMSADEFLEWDLTAPDHRHELVDGVPRAMTGASGRHDVVVVNVLTFLRSGLRGGPCLPSTADIAVKIPNGNVRRPDVAVRCTPMDDRTTHASPRLVVEVLSPSTRSVDRARTLEEYKSVAGLAHILLIDPDVPEVMLWSCNNAGVWSHAVVAGLGAVVPLPALGVALPLADIYDGLTFRPSPRLVTDQP